MSFSYGYHFCNKAVQNCIDARINPEKATLENAIREMKDTAKVLDEQIHAAEKKVAAEAKKKKE
jgi:hypothetical protein